MSKIVALSKYGFKLDSLRSEWDKVDKSLLHRELFNSLEKGSMIDVINRNGKGFITEFILLNHKDKGEGVNRSQITSLNVTQNINSECKTSLPFDSIRYAQSVNLAFASIEIGGFVSEEAGIVYAFDRADKIYIEFNKRCSR